MFYYIAEYNNGANSLFSTTLKARFSTLAKAQTYLRKSITEWDNEGLCTRSVMISNELWGADATTPWVYNGREETCRLVHSRQIFASPAFMGGGSIEVEG